MEASRRFVPVLTEPAYTDTQPMSAVAFVQSEQVEDLEEMRTYDARDSIAVTLQQIVEDAKLLEKAGHTVRVSFTRYRSEYDAEQRWITGLRLLVLR
jgi:hypothetical protein